MSNNTILPPNVMPNMMPLNGMPLNGIPLNGMPQNGIPPNMMPQNGMPLNGMPPNKESSALSTMLPSMLSSLIIKTFNLDIMYNSIIMGIIIALFEKLNNIFSNNVSITLDGSAMWEYIKYPMIGLLIVSALIGSYYLYKYITNRRIFDVVIKNNDMMRVYNKYISIFPDIVTDKYSITEGIIDDGTLCGENRDKHTSYFTNKDVKFYDYNFGINGYINWILRTKDIQTSNSNNITVKQYSYVYLIITVTHIDSDNIKNAKDYFDSLTKLCQSKIKENGELYFSKSFKDRNYYKNDKFEGESYKKENGFLAQSTDSFDMLEKKYINSFFSSAKNVVWKKIKKIHFDPDFFINISQQPRANYIFYGPPGTGKSSFVTRMAVALKRHLISLDLRDFLDKASIYREILSPSIRNCPTAIKQKDVVFILDEFDLLIDELCEQENIETLKAGKDEIIQLSIKEKSKYLRDFTLYDLVEFFQGSIPCDGLVMIAITNDFERIQQKCPKLFRDGRLTPIKFDYINCETLNDLCLHYFDEPFNNKFTGTIDIPVSSIIDKAINCKLASEDSKHNYECFVNEINKLIFVQDKN